MLCENFPLALFLFVSQIWHATVALKPRRLCVGSGRSRCSHHRGQWYQSCHEALWYQSLDSHISLYVHHQSCLHALICNPPLTPLLLLTQLLGQLENTGPPPAEKEMISSLPVVCVSRDQTGVDSAALSDLPHMVSSHVQGLVLKFRLITL